MDKILELVNGFLDGKKLDAKIIVAVAIVLSGAIYSGTIAYEEYKSFGSRISKLEGQEKYEDTWIRKLSDENMNKIIALETQIISIQNELNLARSIVLDNGQKIATFAPKLDRVITDSKEVQDSVKLINVMKSSLERVQKDLERLDDDVNSGGNPLAL